ncbi:MAG: pyridoxal-phosphate-dependent aminotransferase family protein [Myxococcota bacterium]
MPKYRLLTPGPVAVPERVLHAMARTLLHHRAPAFIPVFKEVRANLKKVFQTEQDVLILAATGTGAMEAAVINTLSPGDRAVVVRGGKFGERWTEICQANGISCENVDVEWGKAVEPGAVREAFARAPEAKALFVQASETSTGVYHPVRELAEVTHEVPERLIVVDGISGVGVHDLPMDAWGLDVVVSGSQKSWLLPPGLAFIALSARGQAAVKAAKCARYYFDLRKELKAQVTDQTAWTAPVSLVVGLQESLRMILEEGLHEVFARHEALARATRAAMSALGLKLVAPDSPSFACTAVYVPEGVDGAKFGKHLRDAYNVPFMGGQGHLEGKIFRVGHMGDVDGFDMISAVAAVEMTLADMGHAVRLGDGTRVAMELLRKAGLKRS